ncbi:hypothetical protein E4634_18285 [Mangrovimicrobium sediminis]|uniref:Uncharacterized protein n=1 Tax=Mangrovimicrobium sediminis TaxID=2562682 RepID=A0A4Z0LWH0_9GAMM|nr:hypothetical protein [Haliea sp. SAOS-164]TGD71590.1 hypothetical protein E4634_18285 [Haliea sp. SAOS-164]
MKPTVFIHTNHKQKLGAIISRYSMRRNSAHADEFDVRFIEVKDHPCMLEREGQSYLRDGELRPWVNNDLQSFTPLRFAPPGLMGYQGRAVVVDPDVFAQGDVWDLLSRDMGGAAVMCRPKSGRKGRKGAWASSVMLLDCAKLQHWRFEEDFAAMFVPPGGGKPQRDYMDWISLKLENPADIGVIENEWNDFDHLTPDTKLLHNTKRYTQPWKTGLKIDFRPADTFQLFPPRHWLRRARRALFGDYKFAGTYKSHPDPAQEKFFFELVQGCLEAGEITRAQLEDEIEQGHLREDALQLVSA